MDLCGKCMNYRKIDEKKGRCKVARSSFYVNPGSCLGCQNFREIDEQKVLHSPFDAGVHANVFIHYLEVVITPDGVIHYAVPSHTEFIRWWAKKFLKKDLSGVPYDWAQETGCIMVWENMKIGATPNDDQRKALLMLKKKGLYTGDID